MSSLLGAFDFFSDVLGNAGRLERVAFSSHSKLLATLIGRVERQPYFRQIILGTLRLFLKKCWDFNDSKRFFWCSYTRPSLRKQPFLLAPRRLGSFFRRLHYLFPKDSQGAGITPGFDHFHVCCYTPNKFIAFVRTHHNLVFLWHKGSEIRAITGDCRLAAPINFIRGILAGKLDSFRLDFVCVSDERGSVINDYLQFTQVCQFLARSPQQRVPPYALLGPVTAPSPMRGDYILYSFRTGVGGFFNVPRDLHVQGLWDEGYGLSSLSEKTRNSNRLQMYFQMLHFPLSFLKTLSAGPAGF